MEDHNSYSSRQFDDSIMFSANTDESATKEGDSLLVDLVKGYPHLYNKESKDFKDVNKKNNSWEEIGRILNTTGSDCQIRWTRLRERYSREKKIQEMETRSGSGSTTRPTFHLYEQMNFLKKFVKSRKSITNLTSKCRNESTEKIGSNISQNQIRLYNEHDIKLTNQCQRLRKQQ